MLESKRKASAHIMKFALAERVFFPDLFMCTLTDNRYTHTTML